MVNSHLYKHIDYIRNAVRVLEGQSSSPWIWPNSPGGFPSGWEPEIVYNKHYLNTKWSRDVPAHTIRFPRTPPVWGPMAAVRCRGRMERSDTYVLGCVCVGGRVCRESVCVCGVWPDGQKGIGSRTRTRINNYFPKLSGNLEKELRWHLTHIYLTTFHLFKHLAMFHTVSWYLDAVCKRPTFHLWLSFYLPITYVTYKL